MSSPRDSKYLIANCLAHGRRQFVDLVHFPAECRFVLEMLGQVYGFEPKVRERCLKAAERLQFYQQHSGSVMAELHRWLEAQFQRRKPNRTPA